MVFCHSKMLRIWLNQFRSHINKIRFEWARFEIVGKPLGVVDQLLTRPANILTISWVPWLINHNIWFLVTVCHISQQSWHVPYECRGHTRLFCKVSHEMKNLANCCYVCSNEPGNRLTPFWAIWVWYDLLYIYSTWHTQGNAIMRFIDGY